MILEEIFRGSFSPMDVVFPSDPEYQQLNGEICELMEDMKSRLNPEALSVLDQILRKIYTAQCIENESYFGFAFAAGMQLQSGAQKHMAHYDT